MGRAAGTSALLSLLFVVTYGGTNWLTARRPVADVGTWYLAWELAVIPFVPLLIVPYMSIDLFFVAAPFLCRGDRERRVFARRVTFSILVATAFFLLVPLKRAWPERPPTPGLFGDLVEASCTAPFVMEYPHNLFPSLHIALCLILADLYGRHTRGGLRVVSHVWFGVVALSTMLTWQHHLVDIAGGLVLAGFAFYLFRETDARRTGTTNVRVGCYYATGAALVLALVPAAWPWGLFLLWPAAALAIVAGAYFGIGPGVYRKAGGRLPLSTRFVLAPVLLGQHLSLAYYRRHCRAWDEVAPGVLIGRTLSEAEAAGAVRQGVTAVLDLTAEFTEAKAFRATRYYNLPLLDLTAPRQEQLHEAVAFLAGEAAEGTVYLHCKIGYSRSAAVAAAYLLSVREIDTAEEAVDRLRQARPSIVVRPEALEALRVFAGRQREVGGAYAGPRHVTAGGRLLPAPTPPALQALLFPKP
jgi:predicted protein tyrosine phosphatase